MDNYSEIFNIQKMLFAFGLTLCCHWISPYIYRKVWTRYDQIKPKRWLDFHIRFGQSIAAIYSLYCTIPIFYNKRFSQLGLTEWTFEGNLWLDFMIGHTIGDLVYVFMMSKCGQLTNEEIAHHLSVIVGAVIAHRRFHRFAVLRSVHLVCIPIVAVFTQWNMLGYSIHHTLYKVLSTINVVVYTLFRLAITPFFWLLMLYEVFFSVSDAYQVEWWNWVIMVPLCIAIDVTNGYWAVKIVHWHFKKD